MAVFYSDIYEVIDTLDVSAGWKQIFKKIYTVYYQNFSEGKAGNQHFWQPSPLVSVLGIGDKWKFHCLFNFWALIFGPFYYLAKGLFIKGAVLLLISIISLILIFTRPLMGETALFLFPFLHLYCAVLFNADYFIEKVVKSAAVKKEPRLFGDYVNEAYFSRVADNPKANYFEPFMATVVTLALIIVCGFNIYRDIVAVLAVNNVQFPPVCQDTITCNEKISDLRGKIAAGDGNSSSLNYQLACAYLNNKDIPEALKAAKKSTEKGGGGVLSYILLGNLYSNLQDYGNAVISYNKALQINSRIKNINFGIGRCYYRQRNYSEALRYFELATSKYPCFLFPQYFELQGYTKFTLNKKADGQKDLEAAMRSYEKFPESSQRIGVIIQYLDANKRK